MIARLHFTCCHFFIYRSVCDECLCVCVPLGVFVSVLQFIECTHEKKQYVRITHGIRCVFIHSLFTFALHLQRILTRRKRATKSECGNGENIHTQADRVPRRRTIFTENWNVLMHVPYVDISKCLCGCVCVCRHRKRVKKISILCKVVATRIIYKNMMLISIKTLAKWNGTRNKWMQPGPSLPNEAPAGKGKGAPEKALTPACTRAPKSSRRPWRQKVTA